MFPWSLGPCLSAILPPCKTRFPAPPRHSCSSAPSSLSPRPPAAPAFAQDWARAKLDKSPRHQEWVKIKYGTRTPNGRTIDAFVVYPEVSHKAPVVLLIHEIFGLSDWARSMADDIAAMGYIVIAPDLLSGFGPNGGAQRLRRRHQFVP